MVKAFGRFVQCVAVSAALGAASSAGAVGVDSLTILKFDRSALATARDAKQDFLDGYSVSNLRTETFDGFSGWNGSTGTADPQNTKVGHFAAFGAAGSGRSVVGDGSKTQVRSDSTMLWGRYDSDGVPLGGNWLDSNDNLGMRWDIDGLGKFNTVAFFLLDVADVGGNFSMKIGDSLYADMNENTRLANGNIHLVLAVLSEAVDTLSIDLYHHRTNDGFGIDGASIAHIAPVPIPPAAGLLLAALGLLGGARRMAGLRRAI